MNSEVEYLEDEAQVLGWALGCLQAAFITLIREMLAMDNIFVRLMVVLLLLFRVFDDFLATAMTVAYRFSALGVAENLGRATPGDDYARLVPLMEAVPTWLHAMWVTAGLLQLAGIALFLLRKEGAYVPVVIALGIEIAAKLLGQPIIDATGVAVVANPSLIATVVLPFILPLGLIAAMWLAGKQRRASAARPG